MNIFTYCNVIYVQMHIYYSKCVKIKFWERLLSLESTEKSNAWMKENTLMRVVLERKCQSNIHVRPMSGVNRGVGVLQIVQHAYLQNLVEGSEGILERTIKAGDCIVRWESRKNITKFSEFRTNLFERPS